MLLCRDNPEEIYTPYSSLKSELEIRRQDSSLQTKVRDFLGEHSPDFIDLKDQYAILSRPVATPNFETEYFIDLANGLGLKPLILEYTLDKFVAKNTNKYHLCRLSFVQPGSKQHTVLKLVDFNVSEGKRFSEIQTISGKSLVDFHHELFYFKHTNLKSTVYDFSKWFNATRYLSDYYYLFYLSLFIANGVLMENFLIGDKNEDDFLKKHFAPSFEKVTETFGVKPLIFPLLPIENEISPRWCWYDDSMKEKALGLASK